MRTTIKIATLITGILLLAACEKEIEFDGEMVEPMIVVNSLITPDSVISVHLSKSKFFLSNKGGFDVVDNAEVSIYINRDFKEHLTFIEKGLYKGTIKPMVGDTIRIVAKVAGMEEVESTIMMQSPAIILRVDTTNIIKYKNEEYVNGELTAYTINADCEVKLRIKDNSEEQNYYRLSVKKRQQTTFDGVPSVYEYDMYFALEGVDTQTGSIFNLFSDDGDTKYQHLITDELFNGKEFIFRFKVEGLYYRERVPGVSYEENPRFSREESFIINLQTISRGMYLYLKSKESADNVFGNIFAEPVQIYNNITNGIGIFGAYTNNQVPFKFE